MNLLTAKEYIEIGGDEIRKDRHPVIWLNSLDLLDHCLQADTEQTLFKCHMVRGNHAEMLREDLSMRSETTDDFVSAQENSYKPVRKWKEFRSESGDFDLDRYLAKDELMFTEHRKSYAQGRACTILYDVAVSGMESYDTFMIERHKKVYSITAERESQRKPTRVIACVKIEMDEVKDMTIFMLLKDFCDPIFPGIWGAYSNNRSTNSMLNCICDYFIGTHHEGNGKPTTITNVGQFFPDDELIIYGKRIKE